jgi:DNA polymerase III epsilon subunit-like protein
MIILDIETSGLISKCGIWQIGAINIDNQEYFIEDARIDDDDLVEEGALKVTGKSEEELRDKNKQPQIQLISNYLDWVEKQEEKLFCGQNVGWDASMIEAKTVKYDMHKKFSSIHGQRGNDLHTIVQERYYGIYGKYFKKETGQSAFNLGKILEFCGMQDNRGAHNALEDCKLEGEAYCRLKFGKNLFEEFRKFDIPEYLKK